MTSQEQLVFQWTDIEEILTPVVHYLSATIAALRNVMQNAWSH